MNRRVQEYQFFARRDPNQADKDKHEYKADSRTEDVHGAIPVRKIITLEERLFHYSHLKVRRGWQVQLTALL